MRCSRIKQDDGMIIVGKERTDHHIGCLLSFFQSNMVHMSTCIVLTCWSRCGVGVAVRSIVGWWCWRLIRAPLGAAIGKVPNLTALEARTNYTTTLTSGVPLRCLRHGTWSLHRLALNLALWGLVVLPCWRHPLLLLLLLLILLLLHRTVHRASVTRIMTRP